MNAFDWKDQPSILASDPHFKPRGPRGRSHSEICAESVVVVTKRLGRNPGRINGISKAEAKQRNAPVSPYRLQNGCK